MKNLRAFLALLIAASVSAPTLSAPVSRRARTSGSLSYVADAGSYDEEEDACPKLDRTAAIKSAINEAVEAAVAEVSAEEAKKRESLEADLKKARERIDKLKAEVDKTEGELKEAKAENAELMKTLGVFSAELAAKDGASVKTPVYAY
jgi:septal ring factor EnvC (AmiA/AmiB activator)